MALHLIVGPSNAGKSGRLNEVLSGASRGQPLLVVPSSPDVRTAERELAGKRMLGVRVTTLDGWVEELWGLHGDGRRFVSDAARRALVADAASGMHGALEESGATPGFGRLLSRLVALVADPVVPKDGLAAALGIAMSRYDRLVESVGLVEPVAAYAALALDPPSVSGPVAVNRFTDLSVAQERLLVALSRDSEVHIALTWDEGSPASAVLDPLVARLCDSAASVSTLPPDQVYTEPGLQALAETLYSPDGEAHPLPPSLRIGGAVGVNAECALVAQQAAAASTEMGGSVVIAFKDAAARLEPLRVALAAEGLDAEFDVAQQMIQTAFGRAMAALLDGVSDDPDHRERMIAFLTSPYSGMETDQAASLDREWRRKRAGRGRVAREVRAAGSPVGRIVELAGMVAGAPVTQESGSNWQELAGLLLANAQAAGSDDVQGLADAAAHRTLIGIVFELASVREQGASFDELKAALRETRVVTARETGGSDVLVTEVERIRGRRFETVIIGGLTAAEFSSERPRSLSLVLAEALGQPAAGDGALRERALFHTAVTRARKRLVLVRQVSDAKGEPVRQSVFMDEVFDVYRTREQATEGQPPADLVELGVEQAGLVTHLPALTNGRHAERVRRCLATGVIPARGALENPAALQSLAQAREYSVSEIEAYLSCPYRWFFDRVISPRETDAAFDAKEKGSLAHSILASFYTAWGADGARRVKAENLDEAFALLDGIERTMVEAASRGVRGLEEELALAQAVEWARGIIREDPDYLLGFLPLHHELRFGTDAGRPVTIGGVSLKGSIDRVDVSAGGVVVTDYKSARTLHGGRSFASKGLVQAPVYLAVAASEFGVSPLGCVYRSFKSQEVRGAWLRDALGGCRWSSRDAFDVEELQEVIQEAIECMRRAVEGIRSGDIAPRPLSKSVCERCPAVTFCGGECR